MLKQSIGGIDTLLEHCSHSQPCTDPPLNSALYLCFLRQLTNHLRSRRGEAERETAKRIEQSTLQAAS